MDRTIERIQEFMSVNGINDNQITVKAGLSNGLIGKAKKSAKGINSDNIEKILSAYPELSAEWLLTGKGPMIKENKKSNSEIIQLADVGIKLDVSEIPLYNVDASAGLDKLFADGGELLGKISVPDMPRCDGAVHVIGDSMYPLLKSGDIIAYKVVNDLQSINYGEIYILQLNNDGDLSIVVKYLKHSDKGDEYIKLVSYNKEHDPKDIPLTWVTAIARVTFAIRQFSII